MSVASSLSVSKWSVQGQVFPEGRDADEVDDGVAEVHIFMVGLLDIVSELLK
jgi:hypothetical protein